MQTMVAEPGYYIVTELGNMGLAKYKEIKN